MSDRMVICIFGESCTGKTILSNMLKDKVGAKIYTGRDYLKLSRNPQEGQQIFSKLLKDNVDSDNIIIYVISELEHLSLIPLGAKRILVTADLKLIKERFSKRMNGHLNPSIEKMLENKHGSFDEIAYDYHLISGSNNNLDVICQEILSL